METYFKYGDEEISWLRRRDKRMAQIIETMGIVRRQVIPDTFAALVHTIVGQQISTKAHETIWRKMTEQLDSVTPDIISDLPPDRLRRFGINYRKVAYIQGIAQKVLDGGFDITALKTMNDEQVLAELVKLEGIGRWSAEMLMLFSMQRPNILSFGDQAIQRGLRIIYRHDKIDRKLFEKYRKRFSPFCSVASLYIWAVAGATTQGKNNNATNKNTK